MKLSFVYDNLVSNLINVSNALSDGNIGEDLKNIIMKIDTDSVTLIGATSSLLYKKAIKEEGVSVTKEEGDNNYIAVKIKELVDFLNTYKSLRNTVVDEVIFEVVENKLKCTVVEKPSDDEYSDKVSLSHWMFNLVPIKPNLMPFIETEMPSNSDEMKFSSLGVHTKQLAKILQAGTSTYSKLFFTKDYVYARSNAFTIFMQNETADETSVFSDIALSYRAVNFIEKVSSSYTSDDIIRVAKDERYIYIETSDNELIYTVYDNKLSDISKIVNAFNKDNCIQVNRYSLKEALKRFSLKNDSITITIKPNEGVVDMRNSLFDQQLGILDKKGFEDKDSIRFQLMPSVLNSSIICDDLCEQAGTEVLLMYYCITERGIASIFLSDFLSYNNNPCWFTNMSTKLS